jgi:hypothetical protein
MKLIIKEYLSSLKERDELDAILPDLLSQMGLNVFSRPARGTRQNGVDVAAVGKLSGDREKVYLFSIKAGDLSRNDWNGNSPQALRPSLDQIIDVYIRNVLPKEHQGKDVVICITLGGNIQEQVRQDITAYIERNSREHLEFEEWNGDKLAEYIQLSFLKEDLFPNPARSLLRKSLALIDEPEASSRYFMELVRLIAQDKTENDKKDLRKIRQIAICLWILFSWTREEKNMESAYRASEFALLQAWDIVRNYIGKNGVRNLAIAESFFSIFPVYNRACNEFLEQNLFPYADKLHAISYAVHASCATDINLKLFDLLGRVGADGLWQYWIATRSIKGESIDDHQCFEIQKRIMAIRDLIDNNPQLLLPAKDEQAIDISIAILFLMYAGDKEFITEWLSQIINRARFSYESNLSYPCVLRDYNALLEHPKNEISDYKKEATRGSILYPFIALFSAILEDGETYDFVAKMQADLLRHSTFQFWFPNEESEEKIYSNSDVHGACLSEIDLSQSPEDFLEQVFGECKESSQFYELSAQKFGWWPLIVIACRSYRLPLPLHLFKGIYKTIRKTKNLIANQ